MGLVASCVLSVTGDERVCKFCYGDDEQIGGWIRPCMCSGSLKWVHLRCFEHWMEKAPAQQQMQCQTCRFVYIKSWVLKPFSEWCRPAIKLSAWECIEIFLDTYSTYKFLRGFILVMEGERSIIMQSLHFIFWRVFIATDRRLAYYASLGRLMLSSIFVISVRDCIPDSERYSTNMSLSIGRVIVDAVEAIDRQLGWLSKSVWVSFKNDLAFSLCSVPTLLVRYAWQHVIFVYRFLCFIIFFFFLPMVFIWHIIFFVMYLVEVYICLLMLFRLKPGYHMHWLKEYAIRLVAIIVHEPMLFVQYVLVVIFAFVVLVSVMHWKVQKSVKKQEKISSPLYRLDEEAKREILRKLHDSRRRARDDSESVLVTEKDKNE